ncbi:hypothetical protein JAAARDRAFT_94288, partial [Jaapia argillacea MUCL 33604]
MLENSQYNPPNIPLVQSTPALKQFGRSLFLTCLIFGPCLPPVTASFVLFGVQQLILFPTFIRRESRKHEHGLDAELFKNTQVGLNSL